MPNFILAGEHHDDKEASRACQSGQRQQTEADELTDQSENGEKKLSLTLVQREYSYKCLKSWWQKIEQQINQSSSDDKRMYDSHNGAANYESTPKGGDSELQENKLEGLIDAVQDAEECVQITEPELEDSTHSGRRSMQATPEALFLAEKLQQLADTTREMAQHLLSPEAARPRRVITADCEALGTTLDPESCAENRDLELMRQKILLLDEVVEELSQYRLSPSALDITERLTGETSQSQCLRNESAFTCRTPIVGNTNGEGEDFQQELDASYTASPLAEDQQNSVPYLTEDHTSCSSSVRAAGEELLNAGVGSEEDPDHTEVSSSTLPDDPPSLYFATEVTTDETTSTVQLPQREPQMDSSSSHLDARTSDLMSQDLRCNTRHGKKAVGTTRRIGPGVSKGDRLDRVTTTVQRLLRYPVLRHALVAGETNSAGDDKVVDQTITLQLIQSDVAPSVTEPPQQEPERISSSSHLDTSTSDLMSQELGLSTFQGNERLCEVDCTACQGQLRASQPGGLEGMIALVQRLLRLQIMGHVPTVEKTNTTGDDAENDHVMPWQMVQT